MFRVKRTGPWFVAENGEGLAFASGDQVIALDDNVPAAMPLAVVLLDTDGNAIRQDEVVANEPHAVAIFGADGDRALSR